MKQLALIFAFLVISLAAIPCSGDDDCCKTEISNDLHQSPVKGQDVPCSPFFSCCSCVGFTIPAYVSQIDYEPSVIRYRGIFKGTSLVSLFQSEVWNPPKMG